MKASPRVLPMVTPTDAAATHFPRPDDGDRVTPEDAAATHFPPSGAPRRQAPDEVHHTPPVLNPLLARSLGPTEADGAPLFPLSFVCSKYC